LRNLTMHCLAIAVLFLVSMVAEHVYRARCPPADRTSTTTRSARRRHECFARNLRRR
jgi:hypothetical protein